MDERRSKLELISPRELREMAMSISLPENRFKRTIHGKNKTSLINYILSIPEKKMDDGQKKLIENLRQLDKDILLQHCHNFPDYKKSYDRKSKDYHVDFLTKKKIDLSKSVLENVTEETKKLKTLMSLKKTQLLEKVRLLANYKPSMERQGKEFLANLLFQELEDKTKSSQLPTTTTIITSTEQDLQKLNLKELRKKAQEHPLYHAESLGKSKTQIIQFLCDVSTGKVKMEDEVEEEEIPGQKSPLDIDEFLEPPNHEELKEALLKILTSV